ncbi:glycosyltransferase [Streptomyces sp. NPDC056190]|uniref:glycosyltransferase n=1 Tax=Streptomyces sp. NPDC056190 TaxID=3345741 RepID=UPI0035DC3CE0
MKITFLIHNVYGIGGTIRTTLNLAAALADRHEVTIVSMLRHRARPWFAIDPRVTLVPLVDTRENSADAVDPLLHQPAEVFPAAEKRYRQYSRLTDQRAEQYLRACDADVIIGTRPGVNVYLARFAPPRALRIAQEHLTHDAHTKKLRAQLARHYRGLDALVTTTEAIRGKRFDLLIEAFADIAAQHPDWKLRIYGAGAEKDHLQKLIHVHDLGDRAALMGAVSPIEAEFAKASIVASASDAESFGMTLVEAMRCGVPVVSTDCPLGPAEIIHDGVDGRLVPTGDRQALATALHDLITDEPTRRRMGRAARRAAHRYDPAHIIHTYEDLFADLAASRPSRAWQRAKARWRGRAGRALRRLRH